MAEGGRKEEKWVVWDFDHTMIPENSDLEVFSRHSEILGRIRADRGSKSWTTLISEGLETMIGTCEGGEEEVKMEIRKLRFFPWVVECVKLAGSIPNVHQTIVSDANTMFIDEVLSECGLTEYIEVVISNPFSSTPPHVRPFHEDEHECPRCPSNLCKGRVVEALVRRAGVASAKKIVTKGFPPPLPAKTPNVFYVGDGRGDLCPAMMLRKGDLICAREKFPLAEELKRSPPPLEPRVVFWNPESAGKVVVNALRVFLGNE